MNTNFRNKIKNGSQWAVLVLLLLLVLHGSSLAQGLPGTGPAPAGGGGLNIRPPGQFTELGELVDAISRYIFNISIPIGFGMIVYAGVRFLLARGNPQEVQKAKDILKYVVIGLAIIFIGRGFVTLIRDVLGVNTPIQ